MSTTRRNSSPPSASPRSSRPCNIPTPTGSGSARSIPARARLAGGLRRAERAGGAATVFAAPGTYIPRKNITIAKGVIRGVESGGMMCSPEELGLDGDSSGIFELPADAPVGQAYAAWAGLDDPVIEINLTPNRSDAASVFGIARDLAAAGIGKLTRRRSRPSPANSPARSRSGWTCSLRTRIWPRCSPCGWCAA